MNVTKKTFCDSRYYTAAFSFDRQSLNRRLSEGQWRRVMRLADANPLLDVNAIMEKTVRDAIDRVLKQDEIERSR